ncbi:MAG: hypothetical protein LC116_03915 [Bacteroidetes bacterium]|nr:hypothetical protein [Bacteroidota bacterium]
MTRHNENAPGVPLSKENTGRVQNQTIAAQKYEISTSGRVTFGIEGAQHHYDLRRIFEYCHTPDGTLTFRSVGAGSRRATGELAGILFAALTAWYGGKDGGQ